MSPEKRLTLSVLYDPEVAGKGTPNIDLVLVHGLNGGPIKTWTCDGVVWPRELLSQRQPRTRVLSLGYNADIYENDSVAGIRDFAKSMLARLKRHRHGVDKERSIVFVAHCLGGIIVKQALYLANINPEYQPIMAATRGVLFFGTPHFGSDKNQLLSIAQAFSPLGSSSTPQAKSQGTGGSALVDSLARNSDALFKISRTFYRPASHLKITTFYEMKPWPGTKKCIVDKADTIMHVPNESHQGLDADHDAMCKFSSVDDEDFDEVCVKIQEAAAAGSAGVGVSTKENEVAVTPDTGMELVPHQTGAPPKGAASVTIDIVSIRVDLAEDGSAEAKRPRAIQWTVQSITQRVGAIFGHGHQSHSNDNVKLIAR
ncbi:hypothetical protein B0H63DRAFT_31271 [Podospora didyma]|uniref:DUF676 domain-containing protein n=1 Tax=Podospora didyma TaxID=330526 RepID=A0AAE0U839_9PEZI|nr:hypothetical protein B0H63DRAFT_31271 [Podospora didyma]